MTVESLAIVQHPSRLEDTLIPLGSRGIDYWDAIIVSPQQPALRDLASRLGKLYPDVAPLIEVSLLSTFEGKSVHALMGVQSPGTIEANADHILDLRNFVRLPLRAHNDTALLLSGAEAIEAIAPLFFWKTPRSPNRFKSSNIHLFDSMYLPIELAHDGKGVFLDDRIIDRVMTLGLIPPTAQITSISDEGGWDTIEDLTARVAFEYTLHAASATARLLATALLSLPPVRPEDLTTAISAECSLLHRYGIASCILGAEKGVVYWRAAPPIKQMLSSQCTENERRSRLIQCVELATICDYLLDTEFARPSAVTPALLTASPLKTSLPPIDFLDLLGYADSNVLLLAQAPYFLPSHHLRPVTSCFSDVLKFARSQPEVAWLDTIRLAQANELRHRTTSRPN